MPVASNVGDDRCGPVERLPPPRLRPWLYSLRKSSKLQHVPVWTRRLTRRVLTKAVVKVHLRRCRPLQTVAVTGSMGKTTTKDLVACMLAMVGPTMRTRKNDNGLYGVPVSLLSVDPSDQFAVIELGIDSHPGEMRWMSSLFRPAVAVLMNVSDDHRSTYGSRQAIAAEKRRLLERVRPPGALVTSADDPLALATAQAVDPHRVVTFGRAADADVRIVRSELVGASTRVVLEHDRGRSELQLDLVTMHAPSMIAAAFAAALAAAPDVDPRRFVEGAERFFAVPEGRGELIDGPDGIRFLMEDFKSRPESARAALQTLKSLTARRRIAVIGELSDFPHEPASYAGQVDELVDGIDLVVAVGAAGPPIRELAEPHGLSVQVVEGVVEAAAVLRAELREGDLVLLNGRAYQHLQRVQLLIGGSDVGCVLPACRLSIRCTDCSYLASGAPAHLAEGGRDPIPRPDPIRRPDPFR